LTEGKKKAPMPEKKKGELGSELEIRRREGRKLIFVRGTRVLSQGSHEKKSPRSPPFVHFWSIVEEGRRDFGGGPRDTWGGFC